MRPFYNTPGLFNPPAPTKVRTGKELLYWLEDRYRDYRDDCNKGYCQMDKAVCDKFEKDIAEAKAKA
jgi:hypothetical protein